MVDLAKLLILGLIQGLTEFLPVSSSGHLVLFIRIFHIKENQLAWIVAFHAGTLLSIIIFFWRDLKKILFSFLLPSKIDKVTKKENLKLLYFIMLGSSPAVILGFTFYNLFVPLFQSARMIALALFINGCWLILIERVHSKRQMNLELKDLNWKQVLFIGLGQAVALIPGISRSGATIGCGYLCGLKKELAFYFAFLLALPVIVGALILSWGKLNTSLFFLITIILFTATIGYSALKILSQMIKRSRLYYFAFYCGMISFWAYFVIQ